MFELLGEQNTKVTVNKTTAYITTVAKLDLIVTQLAISDIVTVEVGLHNASDYGWISFLTVSEPIDDSCLRIEQSINAIRFKGLSNYSIALEIKNFIAQTQKDSQGVVKHDRFERPGRFDRPRDRTDRARNKSLNVNEEIMKYKHLLNAGAITAEEFELKKVQLLNLQRETKKIN